MTVATTFTVRCRPCGAAAHLATDPLPNGEPAYRLPVGWKLDKLWFRCPKCSGPLVKLSG